MFGPLWLIVTFRFHQHFHGLVDQEAARLLPRRELLEKMPFSTLVR
jgi:hypothetical protein